MKRGRVRALAATAVLVVVAVIAAVPMAFRMHGPALPLQFAPVVVEPPLRLPGVLVLGASRVWHLEHRGPATLGDPVPVVLTAYCLSGTTRRGRYVRPGIVAAD